MLVDILTSVIETLITYKAVDWKVHCIQAYEKGL